MPLLFILLVFILTACSSDGEVKSTQSAQLAPPPQASNSDMQGQRLALVIGNGNYAVRPLHNPTTDSSAATS